VLHVDSYTGGISNGVRESLAALLADAGITDDLEVVDEVSYEDARGWQYDMDSRHVDAGSTLAGLPDRFDQRRRELKRQTFVATHVMVVRAHELVAGAQIVFSEVASTNNSVRTQLEVGCHSVRSLRRRCPSTARCESDKRTR
jgi:hypothetical protein